MVLHQVGRNRQALSTPSTGEHITKKDMLAGTYPYESNNPILHHCAQPDYNCRCNPDSRKDVRTRFSPSNLHSGGADGARPCVKYRFNSYTSRGLTAACRLYIQNEGLRENFWEDRENGKAK